MGQNCFILCNSISGIGMLNSNCVLSINPLTRQVNMLTFNFFYSDTAPVHLIGETIGAETGYSARSAYLHLTGRDLQADVMHNGVWYDIIDLENDTLYD